MHEQPEFWPEEDDPPLRHWRRRTALVIYGLIVLCVIFGLLATFFPWGELSLPFDPPPNLRRSI